MTSFLYISICFSHTKRKVLVTRQSNSSFPSLSDFHIWATHADGLCFVSANCVGCAIDTVRLCGTFVRRTEWKRIRNSDGLEDGRDPFRRHVEVAFLGQKTIDLLFDMGDLRVAELDVPISIGRPGVCENP